MRVDEDRALLARLLSPFVATFAVLSMALVPVAFAQDDEDEASLVEQAVMEDESDDEVVDNVVVTGSRLKRDTYTSIAPLQIISGQVSREVGLMDVGDILQDSTAAAGQQIDLTFNGFVLDNGPGATNINLRGLGGARTLVLINGRRLAPAGVGGAPTAPDLGLVPASLVQQYDLLLDGASSIYGSDAVAGVANIIMRKDFDGLEIEAFHETPHHSGGQQNTLSVTWGKNFDRGFIGIGAEYSDQERVRLADRPWTERCDRHAEIDEDGNVRTQSVWQEVIRQMPWDDCKGGPDLFTIFAGNGYNESLFYTPGTTNTGIPNWSDWSEFSIVDLNNDGVADINFRDYSTTDMNGPADLFSARKTTSAMAFGEYTFDGDANLTPFFEIQYGKRESDARPRRFPVFPAIPALNPFNPCNPGGVRGVDCGTGQNELFLDPGFADEFLNAFNTGFGATYAEICDFFAISPCNPVTVFGPTAATGPIGSPQHIVYVRGDRDNAITEIDQTRVVLGLGGDIPGVAWGPVENWSFELAGIYSKSSGTTQRMGLRADRLDLALGWYSTTNTPCEANNPLIAGPSTNLTVGELAADVAPGCVPVDLFAPSLLDPFIANSFDGEFATQAERDYLFDRSFFETEYEQTIFSLYFSGDLFDLPGGRAAAGFGFETRKDDLVSLPNEIAAQGLLFGTNVDEGAIGDKSVDEFFAEVELPILAGVPGFQELTVNLSTRYTDDELYGGAWTESYKLGWRPVESVLLRSTFGTSFRAPNLRELFLANQTGFNNAFQDPCYVPLSAINDATDAYDPALDERDPTLLANCLANGVDPTLANINGATYPIEIRSGGSLGLDAETSESWTAGAVWDLPFEAFDLTLGGSYYEISITNTIIEPSTAFIVGDCYFTTSGSSVFCDRITRDFSDPTDPRITLVDEGFINRDNETARGVDINMLLEDTWTVFERPIDIAWDLRANRQLERSTLFVGTNGDVDFEEFQGTFGLPDWRVRSVMQFEYADWLVTWQMNYLGSVEQQAEGIDEFEDAIAGGSDTCFGPPNDVLCRDIGFAENYFRHAFSLFYRGDYWTIGGGIRNAFDERPPFVDGSEVFAINNAPIGAGYDLNGRTYFLSASYNFAGGN